MIRIIVKYHHKAEHGMEAYGSTRLDVKFEEADVDATTVAAAGLIESFQTIFTGDDIAIEVELNGETLHTAKGVVARKDAGVRNLARKIEDIAIRRSALYYHFELGEEIK